MLFCSILVSLSLYIPYHNSAQPGTDVTLSPRCASIHVTKHLAWPNRPFASRSWFAVNSYRIRVTTVVPTGCWVILLRASVLLRAVGSGWLHAGQTSHLTLSGSEWCLKCGVLGSTDWCHWKEIVLLYVQGQREYRPVSVFCVPRELRDWATDSRCIMGPKLCRPASSVCLHHRRVSEDLRREPSLASTWSWKLSHRGPDSWEQVFLSRHCQQFIASRDH